MEGDQYSAGSTERDALHGRQALQLAGRWYNCVLADQYQRKIDYLSFLSIYGDTSICPSSLCQVGGGEDTARRHQWQTGNGVLRNVSRRCVDGAGRKTRPYVGRSYWRREDGSVCREEVEWEYV